MLFLFETITKPKSQQVQGMPDIDQVSVSRKLMKA